MKKTTLYLFFILCLVQTSFSQTTREKKFSIDLFSSDKVAGLTPFYLGGNYLFTQKDEVGLYLGYAGNSSADNYYGGLSAKHYFFENEKPLNLYLTGKLGVIHAKVEAGVLNNTNESNTFDYGAYAGIKYKIAKPLSLFTEIGYGRYDFIRYGISFDL